MKIIDILNLIANEKYDKLPKIIEYDGNIFVLSNTLDGYFDKSNNALGKKFILDYMLNDEVEILKGPENDYIKEMKQDEFENYLSYARDCILMKKLNEVIRKINEMGKSD